MRWHLESLRTEGMFGLGEKSAFSFLLMKSKGVFA